MADLYERLTPERNPVDDKSVVFDLAHIKSVAPRCIELGSGVLAVDDSDSWVSFAVFQSHIGPSTVEGKVVDGEKMELVFRGCGAGVVLRELRHTYWGESGYLFYPNGNLIAQAFAALREWFDCD